MSDQPCDCPACTIGRTVEGLMAREIDANEILTGLLLHSVRIAGGSSITVLEAQAVTTEPGKVH